MSSTARDILGRLAEQPIKPHRERDIRRAFAHREDYDEALRILMKNGEIVTSGLGTKADPKMLRLPGVRDQELCPYCYGTGKRTKVTNAQNE